MGYIDEHPETAKTAAIELLAERHRGVGEKRFRAAWTELENARLLVHKESTVTRPYGRTTRSYPAKVWKRGGGKSAQCLRVGPTMCREACQLTPEAGKSVGDGVNPGRNGATGLCKPIANWGFRLRLLRPDSDRSVAVAGTPDDTGAPDSGPIGRESADRTLFRSGLGQLEAHT